MKTLLVEKPQETFREFIAGVRVATRSVIVHADSIPRAIEHVTNYHDDIRIAICTIERDPYEAIQFVKQVRSVTQQAMLAFPRILILTRESQPEWASDKFEKLGVDCFLRTYPDQIFEKLRLIQWQLRTKKYLPTLYVTRRQGYVVAAGFRSATDSADLLVGAKLRELIHYFAVHPNTEHTTGMLAEELGVSFQSAKMYVHRLREAVDQLQRDGKIPFEGRNVFLTEKRIGGFVYRLRANVVFIDGEQ